MKLYEFQAKELFRKYGVPVPDGKPADTPEQAFQAAQGDVIRLTADQAGDGVLGPGCLGVGRANLHALPKLNHLMRHQSEERHRICRVGAQLLQGHIAAEIFIVRQPHLADPAFGMLPVQRVASATVLRAEYGRHAGRSQVRIRRQHEIEVERTLAATAREWSRRRRCDQEQQYPHLVPRLANCFYWEIIEQNLSNAGWTLGYTSAITASGRKIFIADAHKGNGRRFIVQAGDLLTAFIELERAVR